jgi:8-oxo-dGTP diphosphatase
MSCNTLTCPSCGSAVKQYRNPFPTVDIIIELNGAILLIERRNEPFGWALPGGFVDYGESLEAAAIREAREETSLDIAHLRLLGCYSDPARDARMHTISTVFIATAHGIPHAADDALNLATFTLDALPEQLCFDHARILADYAVVCRKSTLTSCGTTRDCVR